MVVQELRVLFISIEFSYGTFSGNGVLAQSQAKALSRLGHKVLVLCGKPSGPHEEAAYSERLQLVPVGVPVWGRLDAECGWREFAQGCSIDSVVQKIAIFSPEVVVGVDWHSAMAYKQLVPSLKARLQAQLPYFYLNYRVYSRAQDKGGQLLQQYEAEAVAMSTETVALSRTDAEFIHGHLIGTSGKGMPKILLPSLRSDMMEIPPPPEPEDPAQAPRKYLLCCVRLSPEKQPERFVELVEELSARGALQALHLTPFLIGSAKTPYAEGLKARVRAAAPCSIVKEEFVGPHELASIAVSTRLNIHPCLYDAYGMTVVECASQGAPSVVNAGGTVGATDLLKGCHNECFEVQMDRAGIPGLADDILEILGDMQKMREVSVAAARKARSWGELENAGALARTIREAISSQ
mmetsp:Transcript_37689/g.106470  ORF Transcript_37689/g.106470 Transcript_37689/m.106470 type:complete len:408 (+) Transcript_37689:174-1397(+)